MTINLPEYISYSQYNSYKCPRSWYLSKIRKAEELQSWYIPIGSAVHEMIEGYLSPTYLKSRRAEDVFYPLVSAQMEIEPDTSKWLASGPKDALFTEARALQLVKDSYEKALEVLADIDVWEVEYDASGRLPGLSVELKAYVDIVGEYKGKRHKKFQGPMIVDWKTGSKKPDNFQLETYAALLKTFNDGTVEDLKGYHNLNFSGWYAMLAPHASDARPIDLSAVDPVAIGAKYQKVRTAMESMQIKAEKNFMCKMCFQGPNCIPYSGPTARSLFYDRSRYDQPPF